MKSKIIQKILYLISICILFSYGLIIAIKFASAILNDPNYTRNWMWLYSGMFIYISYLLIKRISFRWEINFTRLIFIKIGIALFIYLFVFKLHVDPIWEFHKPFYQYTLLDDEEYFEDPYADDDPLYGRNSSGYSSSLKYFVPVNTELDGLETRVGTIKRDHDSIYSLVKEYDETISLNLSYTIFWQFAYIEGYKPVQEKDYKIGGFLERVYQIGPYYIFELIITNLGSTFLFTLIVILISLFSPSFVISLKDFNSIGLAKVKGYDFKGAIDAFSQAIIFNPQNNDYYFNRGNAKVSLKDYTGAIEDFNRALGINPKNPEYFNNRGNAKNCQSDFKGAIGDYSNAIELDPQKLDYIKNRGWAKSSLKDYNGAIEDYNKAIELNPKGSYLYFNCGLAKKSLKDDSGAIEYFTKAIELNPRDPDYYYNRGLSKYSLKDYSGAIDDHNKAIELDSDFVFAYWNRGNAKDCLKDYNGAIEDFNKVIELNSKYSGVYYARGLSKSRLKDYNNAIEDYDKAIDLNSADNSYFFYRGLAKYYLKDYSNSIKDYDQAIQLNPKDQNTYINRGLARFYLKDYFNAIKDYDQAIELDPNNSIAIQNRKNAFKKIKDLVEKKVQEAKEYFQQKSQDEIANLSPEILKEMEEHYGKFMMQDEVEEDIISANKSEKKQKTELPQVNVNKSIIPSPKNSILEKMKILPTKSTPEIILEPNGIIKIRGRSIPVDPVQFFSPIEDWISLYLLVPAELTCVEIDLEIVNADSFKFLNNILRKITYVTLM
jgi:tetratricopeptide (TPR) repeat protein